MCALLIGFSHPQALKYAQEAANTMKVLFKECLEYAIDCSNKLQAQQQQQPIPIPLQKPLSPTMKGRASNPIERLSIDNRKNSKSETFKEEIDFLQKLLNYSVPFLKDVTKSVTEFDPENGSSPILASKKSFFNWKTIQENNEKFFRKEFKKSDIPDEVNNKRNILGVQHKLEWLESLNIGAMMHMKPTRYKDYASKADLSHEITRDSLHEKVSDSESIVS